jgi:uncharacterized phage protein (TIGR02218 family)
MRDVPAPLAAAIDGDVTSLAIAWRVMRADGVAIGLTSHDLPISVDGLLHRPSPGMVPSAVSISDDAESGGMSVTGALSDAAIRADDITDGRFDGARVEIRLVDWRQPGAGSMLLACGAIGEIERRDESFEAELATAQSRLSAVPIELCSPECRARLGDHRCRVNLAARTRRARVVAVDGASALIIDASAAADIYAYGRVRPLAGGLAGLDYEIVASSGTRIELRDAVAARIGAGSLVELREGCDRRLATCRDRFQNILNFRGEPHVPGTDSIIRYPSL